MYSRLTMAIGLVFALGATPAFASFVGPYAVGNWTQSLAGGSIDLSGAPNSVALTSSDDGQGPDDTDFTITAVGSGMVSFSWAYDTDDMEGPQYDPFGWLLNGIFTQLTDNNGSGIQNGSTTFAVNMGDLFGFRIRSTDSVEGPATATVRDFSAPSGVPEPATLALFALGLAGIGAVRRRKLAA